MIGLARKTLPINESYAVVNQPHGYKFAESSDKPKVLIPKIEAIHAGTTANYTTYSDNYLHGSLESHSGVYSWTYPYPKPVLKNHDTWEEPLGRVTSAQFITDSLTGRSANVIMPTITDPEAIEKILDGRYLTVSIGGETDSAICSICGQDIINEGWCEHNKGQEYEVDGRMVKCSWLIGEIWFHEVSFVNVPADEHAQVVASGNVAEMECFTSNGKEILNLQTDKVLTKEEAELEGLPLNEFKGGNKKVKTVEELQATLDTQTEKFNKLVAEMTTKDENLVTLQNQVKEADSTIQTLTEAKDKAEAEVNTLTESLSTLKTEKEELSTKVAEMQTDKEALLTKNVELTTELHKSVAERVVDLKRSLGKPGCEDREAAIAEHLERSAQSLKDCLSDLLKELPVYTSKVIDNPGASMTKDKQHATPEEDNNQTKLTNEDVFYGLLNYSKSKKM